MNAHAIHIFSSVVFFFVLLGHLEIISVRQRRERKYFWSIHEKKKNKVVTQLWGQRRARVCRAAERDGCEGRRQITGEIWAA